MRICLAGYDGEHAMPADWATVAWKAMGGYGSQADEDGHGRANSHRERLWFSPHCIQQHRDRTMFDLFDMPAPVQLDLLEATP